MLLLGDAGRANRGLRGPLGAEQSPGGHAPGGQRPGSDAESSGCRRARDGREPVYRPSPGGASRACRSSRACGPANSGSECGPSPASGGPGRRAVQPSRVRFLPGFRLPRAKRCPSRPPADRSGQAGRSVQTEPRAGASPPRLPDASRRRRTGRVCCRLVFTCSMRSKARHRPGRQERPSRARHRLQRGWRSLQRLLGTRQNRPGPDASAARFPLAAHGAMPVAAPCGHGRLRRALDPPRASCLARPVANRRRRIPPAPIRPAPRPRPGRRR